MKILTITELQNSLKNHTDEELLRIVYVSAIAKQSQRDSHLYNDIQVHSTQFNKKYNIKGFSCHSNHYFLQCLEGRKQVLLPLFANLYKDHRHTNVRVVLIKPISFYSFSDWQMYGLFLDSGLIKQGQALTDAEGINFTEFLPFKPNGWPSWMFDYFIETMKKFESPEQALSANTIQYDTMRQQNVSKATLITTSFIACLTVMMIANLIVV